MVKAAGGVTPISPNIHHPNYSVENRVPFTPTWDNLKSPSVITPAVTSSSGYLPSHPLSTSMYENMWFHPMTTAGPTPFTFPSMDLLSQAAHMQGYSTTHAL